MDELSEEHRVTKQVGLCLLSHYELSKSLFFKVYGLRYFVSSNRSKLSPFLTMSSQPLIREIDYPNGRTLVKICSAASPAVHKAAVGMQMTKSGSIRKKEKAKNTEMQK